MFYFPSSWDGRKGLPGGGDVKNKRWRAAVISFILLLLLSACTAQSADEAVAPEPGDLQLDHLQEAAIWYNRYHELAPDDLLGLKRLAEVCTALEDPSTGLRAGAGVGDESCRQAAERARREPGDKERENRIQEEGRR